MIAALAGRGVDAEPAVWDAQDVDWDGFDLVVLRSAWDYAERLEAFLGWAARLPRLLNPLHVITWNTDKRYLDELARAGVPVVPTRFLEPGASFQPPEGRFVVKPVVSAGSRNAAAYDPDEAVRALDHVRLLHDQGRVVMVQPYLDAVDQRGETALLFLAGFYSHAVRKSALLVPGRPPGQRLYLEETIDPIEPTREEREAVDRVLSALPFGASELLYARVDLVPGPDGTPLVLELELTEPSLFLGYAETATDRLAAGIVAALDGYIPAR